MIFITVGSQKMQFNRLLEKVDQLIAERIITEEVYAQTGASDYLPRHYQYQAFFDRNEFAKMVDKCDIMITHCGAGSIMTAVKRGKKVIAVPRLARYGEHVDNHQFQLLEQFRQMDLIYACPKIEQLPDALRTVREHQYDIYFSNTEAIVDSIEAFINSI